MSEWKTVRLGDVCEILDSKRVPITAHERKNGSYPYYGANGIQDYVADYIFDDELVLLAEDGGNFGSKEKPIAYRVSGKCWVNNHAHVLKPKECLDVDYLCDSIKFYDVSTIVNGATRQKLTQSAMVEMKIFLPPLETQKQIAKQLNKCTTLLAKHKQMLETYDTLIKSRFIEMFGDNPIENGKWKVEKLKNICTVTSSKRIYAEEQSSDGVPFLRISDLVAKISGNDTCALYIPESKYQDFKLKGLVPKLGDILVTSRGTLGLCYIINPNDNFYFQDGMITWLSFENHNEILSIFLSYVFNIILKAKIDMETNGATVKYISISEMKQLKIPLPPLSLQTQFAAFVQQIDKSKFTVQKSLEKAETLYKSLMQQYFA